MNCVSYRIQVPEAGHVAKQVWAAVFSKPLLGLLSVSRVLGDSEKSLLKNPSFFKFDSLPPNSLGHCLPFLGCVFRRTPLGSDARC